jgi:hypothetical protein
VKPPWIVTFTVTDRAAEGQKTCISRRVAKVKSYNLLDRFGPLFVED